MVTYVIEVTELKFEVRYDLRGCLETTMASEVMKIAIRNNMHIDMRVIRATDLKSKDRSGLRGYLEAALAIEAVQRDVKTIFTALETTKISFKFQLTSAQ